MAATAVAVGAAVPGSDEGASVGGLVGRATGGGEAVAQPTRSRQRRRIGNQRFTSDYLPVGSVDDK
jgi:hypothetical protein